MMSMMKGRMAMRLNGSLMAMMSEPGRGDGIDGDLENYSIAQWW
jgi:hypothetical protein